jgi:hypothetical protein
MHTLAVLAVSGLAAICAGLVGGSLWALTFGGRLLYLIWRRHPETWRKLEFRLSAVALVYSPHLHSWLSTRQYENLGDDAVASSARRLLNPWPALVLMAGVAIVAFLVINFDHQPCGVHLTTRSSGPAHSHRGRASGAPAILRRPRA